LFCTVEDVAHEGAFNPADNLKTKIEYKIKNLSDYMRQVSHKDLSNERYSLYARMACVYGVLMWLESKNLIFPSNLDSVREGNISLTYKNPNGKKYKDTPPTYKELYDHYMCFLLPYPPVGASI
jgi:hypothetical protein